jgi:hypothetical protein
MNDIKEFVRNVNQLHAHYNECNKKFTADQIGFLNKVTEYANQGKNHSDLAKDLNFPAPLVAHIVSTVKEDMNTSDDFNYKKEYGSKFCEKFMEDTKNFIKPLDRSPKAEIEMALDDLDNFWWGDNMWVNSPFGVPVSFEVPKELLDDKTNWQNVLRPQVSGKCWNFNLRGISGRYYLEASSDEEKTEVLEMLRLMNKYLK